MFGALGALSGSKNPLINPMSIFNRKDDNNLPPLGTINRVGALPTPPRYGRGAQSLSV